MSYNVKLTDPKTGYVIVIDSKHSMPSMLQQLDGSDELSIRVTYNYGSILSRVINHVETPSDYKAGLRSLYGLTGGEAIPILKNAIAQLGSDVSNNYFKATEGNVKEVLLQVLAMSEMRPDGIWKGD